MTEARDTVWEVFARAAYEEPLHHVGAPCREIHCRRNGREAMAVLRSAPAIVSTRAADDVCTLYMVRHGTTTMNSG